METTSCGDMSYGSDPECDHIGDIISEDINMKNFDIVHEKPNTETIKSLSTSYEFPHLEILSRTCELPLASRLVTMCRPVLTPGVNMLAGIGYQIFEKIDESIVTNMSEETVSMITRTKQKFVKIVRKSDQVACQCLDTWMIKSDNQIDTYDQSTDEKQKCDKNIDVTSFTLVQMAAELFNLWLSLVTMFIMFGSLFMMVAFAPLSLMTIMFLIIVTIITVLMISITCLIPVGLLLIGPLLFIGVFSTFFYILLY